MAATLAEIRTALKARLATYYAGRGVEVYDIVPGQIVTPCVVVEPASGSYHQTFGASGGTEHTLAVHVMAHLGDRTAAQRTVDQMISETGTLSVVAGIHADRTLGGTVRWADPQSYRDYGTRRYGDADYLMATIDVAVFAQ